jgi:hypothetical protein
MTDHSNLFHEALMKVHDITTNKIAQHAVVRGRA